VIDPVREAARLTSSADWPHAGDSPSAPPASDWLASAGDRTTRDACTVSSPLARRVAGRRYERLALGVAADAEVTRLLDRVPPSKRQPNLLFATVRFLGGMGTDYESFRSFVLGRRDEVVGLLIRRRTQTNEVGRCAILLPVLARLEGPLALVEVGASAGLCLLLDRYRYRYGDRFVGDPSASLLLECEAIGPVPTLKHVPDVAWRRGIDVAPVDVTDDDAVRWLEACVWADQTERIARLRAAVEVARMEPPVVEQGDALERTAEVVSQAPAGTTIVVFHSALMLYHRGREAGVRGTRPWPPRHVGLQRGSLGCVLAPGSDDQCCG